MSKRYCLIVIPNSDFQYSPVYDLGIQPVVEDEGLSLETITVHRDSVPEIMNHIDQAALIIIGLDKREPDVFYIAGICHSRALRTILICESSHDVPLLLRAHRKVVYGPDTSPENLKRFRQELQLTLSDACSDPYQPDTPIEAYFPDDRKKPMFERQYSERLRQLEEENRQLQKQLEMTHDLQKQLEQAKEYLQEQLKAKTGAGFEAFTLPASEKAQEASEKGTITFKPINGPKHQPEE